LEVVKRAKRRIEVWAFAVYHFSPGKVVKPVDQVVVRLQPRQVKVEAPVLGFLLIVQRDAERIEAAELTVFQAASEARQYRLAGVDHRPYPGGMPQVTHEVRARQLERARPLIAQNAGAQINDAARAARLRNHVGIPAKVPLSPCPPETFVPAFAQKRPRH